MRRPFLATPVVLLCACLGWAACGPSGSAPEPTPLAAAPEPVIDVQTARVRRGAILQRITAPGSLMALRESRIGPEVGGRIARIYVEEGERVTAGAPLFQIDPEPYDLALGQGQASDGTPDLFDQLLFFRILLRRYLVGDDDVVGRHGIAPGAVVVL